MTAQKFSLNSSENASLNAVTTGTGRAFAMNDCRQVGWVVTYSTGPSTGTVIIEWAPSIDYAGTWQQLDSILCANLSAGTEGSGSYPGPLAFVRARISSNPDQAITVYINGLRG